MLQQYVTRIKYVARNAGSESKLEGELNHILREALAQYFIQYDPVVNETLRAQGFSQVSSNRPDSMFGHVILDYKKPGKLRVPSELTRYKRQVIDYLEQVTGGHEQNSDDCERWAGILWDGDHVLFCHSSGRDWVWSNTYPISESSLLTIILTYRALQREPLTASRLSYHFGKDSDAARAILPVLCDLLASQPQHRTNMLFREWRRLFEQVSTYKLSQIPSLTNWANSNNIRTKDASVILFALHTYYSLVVKLLTSELLASTQTNMRLSLVEEIVNSPSPESTFAAYQKLENSEFYRNFRISNFLEGDFFSWYANEKTDSMAESLRLIARTLNRFEPATARIKPEAIKDLLKEFYSGLVDEQIRHDLGEYYTPDWLAQYLLDQMGYDGNPSKVAIDPSCGSGTFLIECIRRVRKSCANLNYGTIETLNAIVNGVKGLDLNPLAVISARANYILGISDLVFELGRDIEIPVYLADAINTPEEQGGSLKYVLDTEVDELEFQLPLSLVRQQVLGKVLLKCEDDISRDRSAADFIGGLRKIPDISQHLDRQGESDLAHFFKTIKALNNRTPPWDSIWCRVVKNNFSPKGFGKVDYIIGNVPWVRWSRLPSTYRKRVKKFCDHYGLVSGKRYTGGIESDISTVLAFSAADHWLEEHGKIGVLITWTVFKSESARGFRLGQLPDGTGIRIESIEDLSGVQPFPDATNETGIYFASRVNKASSAVFDKIPCRIWKPAKSARLSSKAPLAEILKQVTIEEGEASPVADFGSPLWTGKQNELMSVNYLRGKSPYKRLAHRGTVNDLARVYWVHVEKYSPETNMALIRTLREDELPRAKIVKPTQGAWIEADLLYPLLRGRETGRFGTKLAGWYQIVPNQHYANFEDESEFEAKYPAGYQYLMQYSDMLPRRSTYKRYLKTLPNYSIYCIGDYSYLPYKVVWPEQQNPKSFRASVISSVNSDAIIPNRVIIPDHKLYFIGTNTLEEAHYLCSFLNSRPTRKWLGGVLLGKQIGTTVFEYMNVPVFESLNRNHIDLVSISLEAHEERLGTNNKRLLDDTVENQLEDLVRQVLS